MKRSDFFKLIGVSAFAPSVLIQEAGKTKEVAVSKFKPKTWPIYPERNQWSHKYHLNPSMMQHNVMSFVKIKHNDDYYLMIVREASIGGTIKDLNKRFEYECEQAQEKHIITDPNASNNTNGFMFYIKYDPLIHHN